MLVLAGIVLLPVLLPISATDHALVIQTNESVSELDQFTMGHVQLLGKSNIVVDRFPLTAASASQSLHARMVDQWTVMDAPEPREVIWDNLSINYYAREVRKYAVYVIVALTIFFFMIPIAFISSFTTLQNLTRLMPFVKPVVKITVIRSVLEAYLPQLALVIFLAMLPKLLMFLSKVEGIPSQSHIVRAASGKYFYFIVLNVFLGVTLGGSLFGNFKEMQKDWKQIPNILGRIFQKVRPSS